MNIVREEWWPIPIWYFDIPQNVVDYELISNECYEHQQLDNQGRVVSNVGGWQSTSCYLEKFDYGENIKNLMNIILDNSQTCFDEYSIKLISKPTIHNFWININQTNHYNKSHIHAGSIFSGVYYAKAPNLCGDIFFHKSPNLDFIHQSFTNCDNRLTFYNVRYKAVPGRVLIFPSWVPHSVEPNLTGQDRISIAFNFTR